MAEQGFGWAVLPHWLVQQYGHGRLTQLPARLAQTDFGGCGMAPIRRPGPGGALDAERLLEDDAAQAGGAAHRMTREIVSSSSGISIFGSITDESQPVALRRPTQRLAQRLRLTDRNAVTGRPSANAAAAASSSTGRCRCNSAPARG